MTAYYNEIHPGKAETLRNMITAGLIPAGDVDERSIEDVKPNDLAGYTQCHFFAGVGIWALALRAAGWPDERPVWTGSCPCFTAGTAVLTKRGNIPIETVRVGDNVLTHTGAWHKVVRIGNEVKRVGDLIGHGHFGLTCTEDHPFYLRERHIQGTRRGGRPVRLHHVSDPYWGAAKNAPGSWWAMPRTYDGVEIDPPAGISPDAAMWLAGFYVGDGWCGKGTRLGRTIFGLNTQKASELEAVLHQEGIDFTRSEQRTGPRIEIKHSGLTRWFEKEFGQYADGKKLPVGLLCASTSLKESFLSGWLASDGSRKRTSGSLSITSISRSLVVTGRMLLVSLGYSASIRLVRTPNTAEIEGRTVNQKDYYRLTFSENKRYHFEKDGNVFFKVKNYQKSDVLQTVYNIEVEKDHSYVADGIVVHNCQPFSSAGKSKGIADERHLWPSWFHLIGECRPPEVYAEQVASKDGLGWLDLVQADMEGTDYTGGFLDLCAAGFGAPHIRQRLCGYFRSSDATSNRRGEEHSVFRGHAVGDRTQGVAAGSSAIGGGKRLADVQSRRRKDGEEILGSGGSFSFETEQIIGVGNRRTSIRLADGDSDGQHQTGFGVPAPRYDGSERDGAAIGLDNSLGPRLEGHRGYGDDGGEPGWVFPVPAGPTATSSGVDGLGDAGGAGSHARSLPGVHSREESAGSRDGEPQRPSADDGLGNAGGTTGERNTRGVHCSQRESGGARSANGDQCDRHSDAGDAHRPGPTNGVWGDADWLFCRDGKWRPVEPGSSPLAYGLPRSIASLPAGVRGLAELAGFDASGLKRAKSFRKLALHSYGDGIVLQQAVEFIRCSQ